MYANRGILGESGAIADDAMLCTITTYVLILDTIYCIAVNMRISAAHGWNFLQYNTKSQLEQDWRQTHLRTERAL